MLCLLLQLALRVNSFRWSRCELGGERDVTPRFAPVGSMRAQPAQSAVVRLNWEFDGGLRANGRSGSLRGLAGVCAATRALGFLETRVAS